MKILIAVPTFETIAPECFKAIYGLRSEDELFFDFVKGYDAAEARNRIGLKAVDGGFDKVLMVDSDTVIPENTLEAMLEKPVDICLGVCPRKNTKTKMTALIPYGKKGFGGSLTYPELTEERIRLKAGGFACALVDTGVFRRLEYPWFRYATFDDGGTLSEDFYFCNNAVLEGLVIEADTRVRCGHLARYFQYE